jgi:hypothetical protein
VSDFNRYIYIVGVFGHLQFYEKHKKFPTSIPRKGEKNDEHSACDVTHINGI